MFEIGFSIRIEFLKMHVSVFIKFFCICNIYGDTRLFVIFGPKSLAIDFFVWNISTPPIFMKIDRPGFF